MTTPTLPQNDSSADQAERARALAWAKTQYKWRHSFTYPDGKVLEPIAILEVTDELPLPATAEPDLIQIFDVLTRLIAVTGNALTRLGDVFGIGAVEFDPPPPEDFDPGASEDEGKESLLDRARNAVEDAVEGALDRAEKVVDRVSAVAEDLRGVSTEAGGFVRKLSAYHEEAKALQSSLHEAMQGDSDARNEAAGKARKGVVDLICKILKHLLAEAAIELLTKAGLYGTAPEFAAFARQFQTLVVPEVSSTTLTDAEFARMRVAGPNPLLLSGVDALPDNFPVDAARFEALTGVALADALAQRRVYVADWAPLTAMTPGSFPAGRKYVSPGLALFAAVGEGRKLTPVAIQCGQEPGNSTPVHYADDGDVWELAKLHIQCADGNYHELISHLGLTHLLIEPFAVATHRNLAQTHPLFLLLLPHIQGTLFINESAITSLIAPEGVVDMLLAGAIESDWAVVANALGGLDFNAHMLPNDLKARQVDDAEALPNYPYRDDALLIWNATHEWVRNYLAIYYNDDAAIIADSELQAWFADVSATDGGTVVSLGEPPRDDPSGPKGIYTFDYLVDVVTMLIFTGSAQHASVNFPQLDIMSFTPAMPLASYAPPPTQTGGDLPEDALLQNLPPLQMSLVQLIIGDLLGGVYFTRLGEYDRHENEPYFSDPRVREPLASFQAELTKIERTIGARNLERANYRTLLPSRVPQSINI
ncbi:Arachidonate 15-lipoxygenase [Plesiocystis pacifica SIR-1]|uniref:Arachidonate 15-lipoxygenase n=1 Tax=Plesiocystis pacifica SIR-1 TaxID=391625 RepID=A6G0H4_9BACT|nr:lipoxygenase family protein [Plesiocystis pacifica]EDM80620.1 Arachidonate 15-lipoxygenase [Plesiocystis pacifica SIR-1]